MKPYRGRIDNWQIMRVCDPNQEHLGYYILGTSRGGRPEWEGKTIITSMVVRKELFNIETLNSRYELGIPLLKGENNEARQRPPRLRVDRGQPEAR